jgi:hypothetical protein
MLHRTYREAGVPGFTIDPAYIPLECFAGPAEIIIHIFETRAARHVLKHVFLTVLPVLEDADVFAVCSQLRYMAK